MQAAAHAAAQAGSQRSEEQLVALSTQLAQQQQELEELQVGSSLDYTRFEAGGKDANGNDWWASRTGFKGRVPQSRQVGRLCTDWRPACNPSCCLLLCIAPRTG